MRCSVSGLTGERQPETNDPGFRDSRNEKNEMDAAVKALRDAGMTGGNEAALAASARNDTARQQRRCRRAALNRRSSPLRNSSLARCWRESWDTEAVARAPFTPDQVASLNAYQESGVFREYTCGNDLCPGTGGEKAALIAGADGWRCPACIYTQDWAMDAMADWTWREFSSATVTVDGVPVAGKWEIVEIPE